MTGQGEPLLDPAVLSEAPPGPVGVAVSGGGDSVALLLLMLDWTRATGRGLEVATVDHGLRTESAAEAAGVAALCARLGVPHQTLRWEGWDGTGNLQAAARDARRWLLSEWAARRGLAAVALGHTRDDQAETMLLRLARGSGVDGLAAMAPVTQAEGTLWLRPLLGETRAGLRAFLRERGVTWTDDPSNDDPRYDRVRARRLMPRLEDFGLGAERLAATARTMARAREALEAATDALAASAAEALAVGAVRIAPEAYAAALPELRLRLLARALGWVSGADYRPRLSALEPLDTALCGGGPVRRTLQGCVVARGREGITVCREPARCGPTVPAGQVWDGRWATRAEGAGLTVGALGEEGLASCPDWRATGLPRSALLASPAFRRGDALIAAPFAMPSKDCHAWLKDGLAGFGAQGRR